MNVEEEYNVAARYRTVRKHLDGLGYKQALSLDALPLIEKLLADLIQTTDSLKYFKSIAQQNIEACSQLQLTVDPYKCDNARLVRECNQLHLDLIESKENHQKQVKDLKKETHRLECECNDLQLASSRNLQRIKELETESSKKSKKILELQGKCLKPTISNVGLASKKRSCYPLRRPVVESEPLPKTGESSKQLPSLRSVEPKVVDLLSMADHKMNCLSHEVTKLKGELVLQTDNVHALESQLTSKEKEIIRLKKMLEGGRPYTAVFKDCGCKKTEVNSVSSHDNVVTDELRILQQTKLEFEQQLKEALNKQHDAMSQALKLAERNEELEKELRDIDHIALAVEADCNSAVKENNRRVCKLQEKLEDVMTQVHVLEGELTVERREVQELRADLEACRLEKRNIQRTLESTLDEKKQMTDRINELTVIASKNHRDAFPSCMQERNDAEYGQVPSRREISKDLAYSDLLSQLTEKQSQITALQHTIGQLSREGNYYRDEYKSIRDQYNSAADKDNSESWTRIRELKRELSEKENALDELQREKQELCREKANLETRLQVCKNEHRKSYRSCSVCKHGESCSCQTSPPTSVRDVNITKTMIERLEHDRDIARADVERLIEERDALRERLKMSADAYASEQRRLRESLTDAETRLKSIEKERQELLLTQGTRRATINGLEDQLDDMREELRRTKQDLGTQRTQYFQLRALQDQTDQALVDVQNQLGQSEAELNKATDRSRAMDRQQQQFESQVKDLKQEINTLRTSMTHMDHEKDQLLMVLDEKTERIAALEREIMSKEQQTVGVERQVRELQHKHEICINQSADQEHQLRSMQLEMENLRRQLDTATSDRENAILENRRLQDDLAAVTCEVRNLQRELEASRAESYDLKRQLQTYVSEVRRAEELLNRKENERTEMLNHFRSLSLEATVLENNNHSLESEAAEARGALQSTRDQLLDLERQLADRDCLARGYETQITDLTQSVASMETQLRQQGEQRHRTEADLTAVRDLCVKLDQQKDGLMQQLGDNDTLKSQYDTQIARLKAEQSIIQEQMKRDRVTVERLETLLDQARQESMNSQTANQELQNEMSRLKQKISELQSKLSAESAELRQYQNQAAEYSKQISELRRQVTNERFDRARKDEEGRRNSEISSTLFLRQEPSGDPTQAPRPNARPRTEWNGPTPQRYLQKDRNADYGWPAERSEAENAEEPNSLQMNYLNETNRCKCLEDRNNACTKTTNNGVNCINITLRRDCSMRSKQYDHLRNDLSVNETLRKYPDNEDVTLDKKYELGTTNVNNVNDQLDASTPLKKYYEETKLMSDNNELSGVGKEPSISQIQRLCTQRPYLFAHSTLATGKLTKVSGDDVPRNGENFKDSNIFSIKSGAQNDARFSKETYGVKSGSMPWHSTPLKEPSDKNPLPEVHSKNNNGTEYVKKDIVKTNEPKAAKIKKVMDSVNNNDMKLKSNLITSRDSNLEGSSKFANYKKILAEYCSCNTISCKMKSFIANKELTAPYSRKVQDNCICKDTKDTYNPKSEGTKSTFSKAKRIDEKLKKHISKLDDETCCKSATCETADYSTLNAERCSKPSNIGTTLSTFQNHSNSTKHSDFKDNTITKINGTDSSDATLKIFSRVLEGAEELRNKNESKRSMSMEGQREKAESKKERSSYAHTQSESDSTEFNSNCLTVSEFTKPEFVRMLTEIKEHMTNLEEKLSHVNKSMRSKKKTNEKLLSSTEKNLASVVCDRNCKIVKLQKNVVTQLPDKRNTSIQEPNGDIFTSTRLKQKDANILSSADAQKENGKEDILEQFTKKKTCIRNCKAETIMQSVRGTFDGWKTNERKNIKNDTETTNLQVKYSEQLTEEKDNIRKEIRDHKILNTCECNDKSNISQNNQGNHNTERSLKLHAKQDEMQYSTLPKNWRNSAEAQTKKQNLDASTNTSFAIDSSTFQKESTLHMNNEHVCCSCCTQTYILSNENSYTYQNTKTSDIPSSMKENFLMENGVNPKRKTKYPIKNDINVALLFTRRANNVCWKSKHRKSKFMKFKAKCIVYSPILVDWSTLKSKVQKSQALSKSTEEQHKEMRVSCGLENCRNIDNSLRDETRISENSADNRTISDTFLTACTQSSSSQIAAATSISSIGSMNQKGRSETCVLS